MFLLLIFQYLIYLTKKVIETIPVDENEFGSLFFGYIETNV